MPQPTSCPLVVDGRRLEVQWADRDGPVIVLINGAGGPLAGWMRVWQPLTTCGAVLAWNRPGLGRSEASGLPQTAAEVTRQVQGLLQALAVDGPVVLVGHSLGGLHALHFARSHPERTAGLVLLEATAPEDVAAMPALASPLQRRVLALSRRWCPPDPNSETEQAPVSVQQLASLGPCPPVPLRVVTGQRPALAWLTPPAQRAARAAGQRALVGLSPLGVQVLAQRSGHFPQLSEPDLVVQTIADACRAAGERKAEGRWTR